MRDRIRLAQLILAGLGTVNVTEVVDTYITYKFYQGFCCCVLGLALVGKCGNAFSALEAYEDFGNDNTFLGSHRMASLLDIPVGLAQAVSKLHQTGQTAKQIVTTLLSSID